MIYDLTEHGIRLEVEESWTIQPVDDRMVIAHPIEYPSSPPQDPPISVSIVGHETTEPMDDFASKLMHGRTTLGPADQESSEFAGKPAIVFSWTDGVLDIESEFTTDDQGRILEFVFAAEPRRTETPIVRRPRLREYLGKFVRISRISSGAPA